MLLAGVYASAGENYFQTAWDAKGLLALEGAFGQAQTKLVQDNPGAGDLVDTETDGVAAGGFKLGGESENYRLFLSGRYHVVPDYDYVATVGAELQYLIRSGENFNIFFGVNGGMMRSQATDNNIEYTVTNSYLGGDVGVNFDISQNFGLELGARLNQSLGDKKEPASIDYLAEGYVSLVFKFTGDY